MDKVADEQVKPEWWSPHRDKALRQWWSQVKGSPVWSGAIQGLDYDELPEPEMADLFVIFETYVPYGDT